MLRGREIYEKLHKHLPKEVVDVLVQLGEEHFAVWKMQMDVVQMVDQMSNMITDFVKVTHGVKMDIDKIKKRYGKDDGITIASETPNEDH